jgi:hypothetical protein
MARDWQSVLGTKAAAWGIPSGVVTDLGGLITAAQTALTAAQNESTRTPLVTVRCGEAFDALSAKMQDIKERCFLTPPLTNADYISLGLETSDPPAPGAEPSGQATLENFLLGRCELGVKIVYVTGNPDDPANKGYRIWYSVTTPGETPPADPGDLRKSFFTKRKKDLGQKAYGFLSRSLRLAANSTTLWWSFASGKTPKLSGAAG